MSLPATKTISPKSIAAYEIAQKHMGSIMDKQGFEAYQCFRDFFAEICTEPEKIKPFLTDESHYRITGDFHLFDQAYIDNLILCLTVKIKSPDVYEEMLKIIDKYVKPTAQNEGFNHLYQECGGFLAFLLQHYEGVSGRQAYLCDTAKDCILVTLNKYKIANITANSSAIIWCRNSPRKVSPDAVGRDNCYRSNIAIRVKWGWVIYHYSHIPAFF